ncbi:MAG: polysaccharide deacetylase family protein [Ruminococcus sp.]|jgi:glucan-binding YG repeat protein
MKGLKTFGLILGISAVTAAILFGRPLIHYAQEEIALARWEPTPSGTVSKPEGRWNVDDQGWQYTDSSGQKITEQWRSIDGKDYYFGKDGYMTTGWIQQDGKWYYLDFAGEKETGWLLDGKKRYYLGEDGVMVTGWQTIRQTKYHFEEDGSLSTGWIQDGDTYYYINEEGEPHTGWLVDAGKYYYMDEQGVMQRGWFQDGDAWYYLGEDGAAVSGWQTVDNKNYFFDETGAMHIGWLQDGNSWYYFDTQGSMQTGWLTLDDGTYYLNGDGKMHTGWLVDGRNVHFFDEQGRENPNAGKVEPGTKIALTFDDGPGPYTDRLLNCLESNDAKATFFVLGQQIGNYPETLQRMYRMGCQIGNHSFDHTNLTGLDEKEVKNQITSTNKRVKSTVGRSSWLVRPPGGNYTEEIAAQINQPLVLWSLDTRDWETKSVQATVENVLNNLRGGDIILMHDIHETSVEAAEVLIPTLKSMGYDLVTVGNLAKSSGAALERGKVYRSFP